MRTASQALAAAEGTSVWYPVNACLNFVWNMFGKPDNQAKGVPLGYALQSWQYTAGKHTDRNYPVGAPLYWRSPTNTYGHIAIYKGMGIVRSTYTPDGTHGVVGDVSISHIEARTGWNHTYVGWGSDFAGYPIDFGNAPVASTPAPPTTPAAPAPVLPEEDEMNFIIQHSTGSLAWVFPAAFDGQGAYRHITPAEWNAISATTPGIKVAKVTDADWTTIIQTLKPVSGVVGQ